MGYIFPVVTVVGEIGKLWIVRDVIPTAHQRLVLPRLEVVTIFQTQNGRFSYHVFGDMQLQVIHQEKRPSNVTLGCVDLIET